MLATHAGYVLSRAAERRNERRLPLLLPYAKRQQILSRCVMRGALEKQRRLSTSRVLLPWSDVCEEMSSASFVPHLAV